MFIKKNMRIMGRATLKNLVGFPHDLVNKNKMQKCIKHKNHFSRKQQNMLDV